MKVDWQPNRAWEPVHVTMAEVLVQLLLPSGELLAAAARVEAWPPSLTKTASEAVQHLRAEKYM